MALTPTDQQTQSNGASNNSLGTLLPELRNALGNLTANIHNSELQFIAAPKNADPYLQTTISLLNTSITDYFKSAAKITVIIKVLQSKANGKQVLQDPTECLNIFNDLADALSNILHVIDAEIFKQAFGLGSAHQQQLQNAIKQQANLQQILVWFKKLEDYADAELKDLGKDTRQDKSEQLQIAPSEIYALLASLKVGAATIRYNLTGNSDNPG